MANNYWNMMYGSFKTSKPTESVKYVTGGTKQFAKDWNKAVERLKGSGADLSKILLVGK